MNGALSISVSASGGLVVTTNTLLVGSLGATALTGDISTNSVVTPTSSIQYTVVTAPTNGTLKDGSIVLGHSATFSQQDVDNGTLTYTLGGPATVSDSFTFTVSDGSKSGAGSVGILNAIPPAVPNHAVTVGAGQTVTLTPSQLSATAAGMANDQLTYTLTTSPSHGHIIYYGFQQGQGTTFTQADINLGAVQYAQDHSAATPPTLDSFAVTVSDSLGASTGPISVGVTITPGLTQRLDTGINLISSSNNGNDSQIDKTMLYADDHNVSDSAITYTLVTMPVFCSLQVNNHGDHLQSGGTFTQNDIDNNNLSVSANGVSSGADSFTFIVSDAHGSLPTQTFTIKIYPGSTMSGGQALVQAGGTLTFHQANIDVTNPDLDPSQIVITLNNTPFAGQLMLNGVPLEQNGTFTQADVNAGNLTYVQNGNGNFGNSVASDDSFQFNYTPAAIQLPGNNNNNFNAGVSITINTPPRVVVNAGITFTTTGASGTVVIGDDSLRSEDPEQGASQLTYTLTTAPGDGAVELSGVALGIGGAFTQQDINLERVTFVPSSTSSDGFHATVSDGMGGSATLVFAIHFTSALTVIEDNLITCQANSSVVIQPGDLTVAETGVAASSILYTVISIPPCGVLEKAGVPLANSGTFHQSDIVSGNIRYVFNVDCESDGVQLAVTDSTTTLDLLVNVAINHPPTMAAQSFNAVAGIANQIDTNGLRATDPEQADHQLTYTLTAVPSVGTIFRNGQSVGLSGSFTQQDIDNGALDYVQDRGSAAGDSFTVSVSDGHGGTTPGQVVTVSIISSMAVIDDGPLVVTSPNSGNHHDQIGSSILRTVSVVANSNNNGNGDNNIFYQIVTAPTVGTLLKNGTPRPRWRALHPERCRPAEPHSTRSAAPAHPPPTPSSSPFMT